MQVCPKCQLSWEPPKSVKGSHEVFVGDDGDNPEGMEEDNPENPEQRHDPEDPGNVWDEREKKDWERKLKLIHSATGHGSVASLVDALKKRGAAPKVIQLAREFVCDVCEERKRPNPRRVSTLEVIPKRWRVVLVDCAVWRHPKTGKRAVIGLCMDQGSRFLVGKVLVEHTTQNPNAEQTKNSLRNIGSLTLGCLKSCGVMLKVHGGLGNWMRLLLKRMFTWTRFPVTLTGICHPWKEVWAGSKSFCPNKYMNRPT